MKTLIDRIREAGEWDAKPSYDASFEPENISVIDSSYFVAGAKHQHAQSAWMREALLIAVEALEFYADKDNWDDDQFSPTIWDDGAIDLGMSAKKAIAKIAALVPKGEK